MLQKLPKQHCSLMNPCLALNRPWRPYMLCLSVGSQFPLGPSLCHGSLLRPGGCLLRQLRTGGLLLCLLHRGGLLPCLLYTGGLLLCLLRRGGLLPCLLYTGGLLLCHGVFFAPAAPPWWAPVPSVPSWWALFLSALPWYSALPALPRFLVSSLPHGPGPPSLPRFHLRSKASLIVLCLERLEAPPWGGGLCHKSGSWASLNSPPEVTCSPHGLLYYTHCCTPPQTAIPITHCTEDTHC